MACALCKGRVERRSIPFTLERNGYHVTWDAVPARVCTKSGEPISEEREVESIQEALTALDRQMAALSGSGGAAPTA